MAPNAKCQRVLVFVVLELYGVTVWQRVRAIRRARRPFRDVVTSVTRAPGSAIVDITSSVDAATDAWTATGTSTAPPVSQFARYTIHN